jgi:transposase
MNAASKRWWPARDITAIKVLVDLAAENLRGYIPEPERGRRNWQGKEIAQQRVYANRRRVGGRRGKDLQKLRSELVERSFAHMYETGGMRRAHLRKRGPIALTNIGLCR